MGVKPMVNFTFILLFFSAALAFIHDLLVMQTALIFSRNMLFGTYVFMAVATLVVFGLTFWVSRKNYERAGLSYLGFGLLKMMAFVLYLMPALKADDPALKSTIFQQLAVYLLFLAFEAASVYKLLRRQTD
jgi:uncharacterized membrane protein